MNEEIMVEENTETEELMEHKDEELMIPDEVETDEFDFTEDEHHPAALAAGALIVGIGAAAAIAAKKMVKKAKDKRAEKAAAEPEVHIVKLTLKERLTGKMSISTEEIPVVDEEDSEEEYEHVDLNEDAEEASTESK